MENLTKADLKIEGFVTRITSGYYRTLISAKKISINEPSKLIIFILMIIVYFQLWAS